MTYLDYAATYPLLEEVKEAMHEAEDRLYGNASSLHTPGHLAMNEIEKTRALLAELINATPEEIIFTSGASEANNTIIRTFEGHQIETSPIEHHSILEPAKIYKGNKIPKLFSFMLANNETGEILKLPEVDHENTFLHSDLSQALGKIPVDVKKLNLDYATFSAHKIGGPLGVGAMYVRKGAPFKPLILGGNQEHKLRGGTYNTVGIIGFSKALEIVRRDKTWEIYDTKIRQLRDTLASRISKEITGSSVGATMSVKSLPNILNASFEAAEGESIQLYLDAEGIIVSTGSACASGDGKPSHVLMNFINDAEFAHSSIRFSFGLESTMDDVDRVMAVLPGIITRLQGMSTVTRKENK